MSGPQFRRELIVEGTDWPPPAPGAVRGWPVAMTATQIERARKMYDETDRDTGQL
ncbi:hypothetical protein [Actinoallomurus sp. CA-150999]|uniref:hypothetical protein n=1 Tax=Actinoallomurus sp. CA-150999 TaxID=3239887 RepID=UPI003D8AD66B